MKRQNTITKYNKKAGIEKMINFDCPLCDIPTMHQRKGDKSGGKKMDKFSFEGIPSQGRNKTSAYVRTLLFNVCVTLENSPEKKPPRE